jgi:hypothetical protein
MNDNDLTNGDSESDNQERVSAQESGTESADRDTKTGRFLPGNSGTRSGGAPRGNLNGWKHGGHAKRLLPLQRLPKGCQWIGSQLLVLRAGLEADVVQTHGMVSTTNAALIKSACLHEQHVLFCQRDLRALSPKITLSERLSLIAMISKETDARDRCIEKLKLDTDPQTIMAGLYALPYDQPT